MVSSPVPPQAPSVRGNSCAPRERPRSFFRPVQWPSVEGWIPVADEALRVAHAAYCGAVALKNRPRHDHVAHFLLRRAEMLSHLVEALSVESRCEDNLRKMSDEEVLAGLSEAEEGLSAKVRSLLARHGLKLQIVKLLEQECILGQASRTQIKLAQMEQAAATLAKS